MMPPILFALVISGREPLRPGDVARVALDGVGNPGRSPRLLRIDWSDATEPPWANREGAMRAAASAQALTVAPLRRTAPRRSSSQRRRRSEAVLLAIYFRRQAPMAEVS
jgi:hypothetical protein